MTYGQVFARSFVGFALLTLAGCGNFGSIGSGDIGSGRQASAERSAAEEARADRNATGNPQRLDPQERIALDDRTTIWDLFNNADDPNVTVEVNKYIWQASLEVLNFLPIQAADPFSGVFVTGYGRPPGGGAAYRATVHVTDPALDARSLSLAMERQGGGAVDADTLRAVEDAILTRARQLRQRDASL